LPVVASNRFARSAYLSKQASRKQEECFSQLLLDVINVGQEK
jgi:hypothetical protein